ncbi:DUF3570 domain-containing protein [Methylobacter sp. sgz302048]|uniref:DUF3570 domain-containing protein n=1 Tax=Methylobacter sp. sgz302048 TaxID=3455945 RepID=UPI003FA11C0B
MAVIKPRSARNMCKKQRKPSSPINASLQALTAAALALPGLMPASANAAEEEASFQYGHYQEGRRDLAGVNSRFNPIEVDTIQGSGKIKLSDRIKFAFDYIQDTWSGATPVATAPLSFGGNREGGIIAGATPFLQNNTVYFDRQLNPLKRDPSTGQFTEDTQLVHTLSTASPETRKQGNFKLGYEWDEAALDVGGGISTERDYESRFGSLAGRLDFNQKRTSLNLGLSYTNSDTDAILDHDATPYIYDTAAGLRAYNSTSTNSQIELEGGNKVLTGNRQDWATTLGLTQVLNKNALIETGVGYTRSTGYLANPYKAVETAFINPGQTGDVLSGLSIGLLEKRPDERDQLTANMRYVQYIEGLDAAVHFDYRFFHDDWGINAHTFEADWSQPLGDGWTVTPRIRYYSQDAADFYTPYLVSQQAYSRPAVDANGNRILLNANAPNTGLEYIYDAGSGNYVDQNGGRIPESQFNPIPKTTYFDPKKLPAHYSSDQRLSGYGALSGGITVSKQFAKGVSLEAGAEYYTHAGSLKLDGGGEGAYADFDFYMVNAALKVDLSALSLSGGEHAHHHHGHHGGHAPAGVMFDHMLSKSGDFMVGYRYMYGTQAGDMLHGSSEISDPTIVSNGCEGNPCFLAPSGMNMHMHMLDIMYAPTDWLNLMLMPQFVAMDMTMRRLDGAPAPSTETQRELITHHTLHQSETGGVGDTGLYAMFKLFDRPNHHLHATLGLSAPTGDVGIRLRDTHRIEAGFIHYGMQLGSGTWDFKPSLTYTGQMDKWSWGAQLSGTKRLEDKNDSGFAFGDIFQSTAWGNYSLLNWLSASVRGVYTIQGSIRGQYNGVFNPLGPMDSPSSHGGRYWDVGFGLNAVVPSGSLAGNRLGVEWLQPVHDDVNGYQLPRDGALSATWSYAF